MTTVNTGNSADTAKSTQSTSSLTRSHSDSALSQLSDESTASSSAAINNYAPSQIRSTSTLSSTLEALDLAIPPNSKLSDHLSPTDLTYLGGNGKPNEITHVRTRDDLQTVYETRTQPFGNGAISEPGKGKKSLAGKANSLRKGALNKLRARESSYIPDLEKAPLIHWPTKKSVSSKEVPNAENFAPDKKQQKTSQFWYDSGTSGPAGNSATGEGPSWYYHPNLEKEFPEAPLVNWDTKEVIETNFKPSKDSPSNYWLDDSDGHLPVWYFVNAFDTSFDPNN